MDGSIYNIVFPFRLDYEDYYWKKFTAKESDDEPIASITCEAPSPDIYAVEKLPVYKGGSVFRTSESLLFMSRDFTEGRIIGDTADRSGVYGCAMIALYGNLIRRDTLVMHGSMIELNGRAVVFTGPSGIGKTTQAQLWQEHRSADIVNGDMTFIHKDSDGNFYAYGSPWHGSSEYCLNRKLPLAAIISLSQSDECKTSKISGLEMLKNILPEVMLPDWFDGCKCLGIGTLDSLLNAVPVYQLECTKDIRAVETAEKELGKLL